jgi:phage terminase large subunit-like protein
MWVVGLGPDNNYYVLDFLRDKFNLTERAKKLFDLHQRWLPMGVAYEKYSMQADIEHIEYEMEVRNYRFDITPVGGSIPQKDRIRRLVPLFEGKRIYLPRQMMYVDHTGSTSDMVRVFREEEYLPFPVGFHPDMLDSLARIVEKDLDAKFPRKVNFNVATTQSYGHIV